MNSYYETFNKPQFSLLDDNEFKGYYGQNQSSEIVEPNSAQNEMSLSPSTAQAASKGAQAGGLSGALISGGTNSLLTSGAAAGGPYAIAGGLLLSELQAAQEAKIQSEAQRMQNEKDRYANMQGQLNSMSKTVFKV